MSISSNKYNYNGRNLSLDINNTNDVTCKLTTAVDVQINYLCPHCGESYYMENYRTRTCMYFPPIYKDGVNINPDKNTTTVHCTCMNCGKDFSFTD